MRLRTWLPVSIVCLVAATSVVPVAAQKESRKPDRGGGGSVLRALVPGEFVTHQQEIPVDIVLVGFTDSQARSSDVRAYLPATYTPVVRYPRFYGLNGRDLGLEYTFRYSVRRTSKTFNDRFFAHLRRIGKQRPLTDFQAAYNDQEHNILDVTGPILEIDAPSVEQYLEKQAKPRANGYTVYFINWYNRPDFRFHVYTKKDDPDPDTGYNFGELRASRRMVAWGGSVSRSWFYDFSAGPESWAGNWNVDDEDLDGDGLADYRMPPIWEYASSGYRSPADLGTDMSLLTRFVAIDELFTPSPLYDPLVTAPDPLGRKVVHTTILEDDPESHGGDYYRPAFAQKQWRTFEPYYRWKAAVSEVDPIDAAARESLQIFSGNSTAQDCWTSFGTPFAQLFCFFSEHLSQYVPDYHPRDYVVPVMAFNTTEEGLGSEFGLLGFADDNWVDGTQSLVFTFDAEAYRELGYGFTGTIIHEVGHHIGMSHAHDGYDSELDIDFGPGADLYFAWAGDESHTVMHYLALTNEFGEHNRDNMYRWEMAGYLNRANALAGDILASPDAWRVSLLMKAADALAGLATSRFEDWRYLEAVTAARAAYDLLTEAANLIGVSSESLARAQLALPESRITKYICRLRDEVETHGGGK